MGQLPEGCYRVSIKALIFDDQGRLLVSVDKRGEWEIPGGGWDHDETFVECVTRELHEELRAKVVEVGAVLFATRGINRAGYPKVSLAARVTLVNFDFTPTDDGVMGARFVTKQEFLQLPFQKTESSILDYADKIWP